MIHMQQNFENVNFMIGDSAVIGNMPLVPALPVFSDDVLCFLDTLSKELMHSKEAKMYPDVIAYAFWIRRNNLEKEGKRYSNSEERIGRGVVFHIAPSNIPVQFAVSLVYALVAGNASIIRVSSKEFPQVAVICNAINKLLKEQFPNMAKYLCVVRYPHDESITQSMTDICDARLIWGGNNSVNEIRNVKISPRCIDLGFADRYSFSVIDSDEYLRKDATVLANDFYNDTFFSDQNACSSPRMIIWTGDKAKFAQEIFWKELSTVVHEKYNMDPIQSSNKLLNTAVLSTHYGNVRQVKDDNLIVRIELDKLYDDIMDFKGNCGYFFEYTTDNLEEMVPLLKKECQTITYVGENIEREVRRLVFLHGVRGVDRIVPMGHGSDISFVWDGLDLPIMLSREVGKN